MRLDQCKTALEEILSEEKLSGASLLVMANKQDIDNAVSIEEIADFLELDSIVNRDVHIEGCSALTGDGLQEGIGWIIEEIGERIYRLD